MPYVPFDDTVPDAATESVAQMGTSTRENLAAMRDAVALGAMPGWNYSKSNGSGTAEQPQYVLMTQGAEIVRQTLTWGTTGAEAGNVTQILAEYSSTSGASYDAIGTLTVAYDASGNVTTTTWS